MDVALSSYPDKLFPPGRSTSGRLGEPMSPRRPTERTANRSRILHSCAQCAENRYVTGHQGSSVARGSSRIEGCGGDVPCCLINACAWCDLCMIFRYHMAFLRGLKVCIDHSDKRHRSCINGRFLIPTRFPRRLWSLDRDRVSSGTMTGAPRQGAPLRSRPYRNRAFGRKVTGAAGRTRQLVFLISAHGRMGVWMPGRSSKNVTDRSGGPALRGHSRDPFRIIKPGDLRGGHRIPGLSL